MNTFFLSFAIATLVPVIRAQMQEANCTDPNDNWVYNSIGLSPCRVAEQLVEPCGISLNVPPLPSGGYYQGPSPGTNDSCRCNSVFYSLLAGCALCQDGTWQLWDVFTRNCSTVWLTIYPDSIPPGTKIPSWAFLNVSINDQFDPAAASAVASSKSHTSHAGEIAGGVIGGAVGLALVAGALLVFYRRRIIKKASFSGPSDQVVKPDAKATYPSSASLSTVPHSTMMPKQLYDPQGSTILPGTLYETPSRHSPIPLPNNTLATLHPSFGRIAGDMNYTGAPEI